MTERIEKQEEVLRKAWLTKQTTEKMMGNYGLLQSLSISGGTLSCHILKETAKSTHTLKTENHGNFLNAMRGMQ